MHIEKSTTDELGVSLIKLDSMHFRISDTIQFDFNKIRYNIIILSLIPGPSHSGRREFNRT